MKGFANCVIPQSYDKVCNCEACRIANFDRRAIYDTGLSRLNVTPAKPGETLQLEVGIMGPFQKSTRGNTHAVVGVVRELRMKYCIPIPSKKDAPAAVGRMLEEINTDPRYFKYKAVGAKSPITTVCSDMESSFSFTLESFGIQDVSREEVDESKQIIKKYREICKEKGVIPKIESTYCSSFNGQVENANRTIRRTACAMLWNASLSPKYWDSAFEHGVKLINCRPSSTLKISEADLEVLKKNKPEVYNKFDKPFFISPYWALSGCAADCRNIRTFGSTCYAMVQGRKKGVLGRSEARKMLYMGNSASNKGWILECPVSGMRTVSSHVVCIEDFRQRDDWLKSFDEALGRTRCAANAVDLTSEGLESTRRTDAQNQQLLKFFNQNEFRKLFKDNESPTAGLTPDDPKVKITGLFDSSELGELEGDVEVLKKEPLPFSHSLLMTECRHGTKCKDPRCPYRHSEGREVLKIKDQAEHLNISRSFDEEPPYRPMRPRVGKSQKLSSSERAWLEDAYDNRPGLKIVYAKWYADGSKPKQKKSPSATQTASYYRMHGDANSRGYVEAQTIGEFKEIVLENTNKHGMDVKKGKADFFDDLIHGFVCVLPASGRLPNSHLDRSEPVQQMFQCIDEDPSLPQISKDFLKGYTNTPEHVQRMDEFLDNKSAVDLLAEQSFQSASNISDQVWEDVMVQTQKDAKVSDGAKFDGSWSYQEKWDYVVSHNPSELDEKELKTIVTDEQLIERVETPGPWFGQTLKSKDGPLWRYALALEIKVKYIKNRAFRWGNKRDPTLVGRPMPMINVAVCKKEGTKTVQLKVRVAAAGTKKNDPFSVEDTFAATPGTTTLKAFLARAAKRGFHLGVGDLAAAFTSTPINQDGLSVSVPPGVEPQPNDPGYADVIGIPPKDRVLILEKNLEGLNRAPKGFQQACFRTLKKNGYTQSIVDPCLFYKTHKNEDGSPRQVQVTDAWGETKMVDATEEVLFHVDDAIVCSPVLSWDGNPRPGGIAEESLVPIFREEGYELKPSRVIPDGKSITYFVGLEIQQSEDRFEVFIGVEGYLTGLVRSVLGEKMTEEEWDKETSNWTQYSLNAPMVHKMMLRPVEEGEKVFTKDEFPYRRVVGGGLWASAAARPDLSQTIRQLSRFCLKPGQQHVDCSIHMLKYIWLHRDLRIRYSARAPTREESPNNTKPANMTRDLSHYTSSLYVG